MIVTTLESGSRCITHTGSSGFTITGQRSGDDLAVMIEIGATIPREEAVALIGSFITFLEEQFDESFVTACMGHYALETGKKFMEAGDHKVVMIRGGNRGKKK